MENTTAGHIGIFGGSFSPPHTGHVLACHYALLRWGLEKVIVIPSYQHPFAKSLPPYEDRLAMCRLAFQHLSHSIEISDIERQLGGVSYTIDTVKALRQQNPQASYHLLIGGDILPDTEKWRQFEELSTLAPLLVIPRISEGKTLGGPAAEAALPDVSSTAIRNGLAGNTLPAGAVPHNVMDYIRVHSLYTSAKVIQ